MINQNFINNSRVNDNELYLLAPIHESTIKNLPGDYFENKSITLLRKLNRIKNSSSSLVIKAAKIISPTLIVACTIIGIYEIGDSDKFDENTKKYYPYFLATAGGLLSGIGIAMNIIDKNN
ncbi:hypothetical protein [Biostraticola tofi]|uniref:Uncharacterized protein n=1 Tax=Biostraticola tofi TaxID=466109 RepID=A0A4R3YR52_9GAMM|nr:hypothetical protein [Biostraticola tofi]TCV95425.1 hypothetical protein EDC52_10527 [Biostraticola tofi]